MAKPLLEQYTLNVLTLDLKQFPLYFMTEWYFYGVSILTVFNFLILQWNAN